MEGADGADLQLIAGFQHVSRNFIDDRRGRGGGVLRVGGNDEDALHSLITQLIKHAADRWFAVAHGQVHVGNMVEARSQFVALTQRPVHQW